MSGRRTGDLHLGRWVVLLAAAEAVGMIAAAAAAQIGQAVVPNPVGLGPMALAIGLAIVGGIVEGAAVGAATAHLLHLRVVDLPVRRWIAVTTVVAAIGWGAGTVPAAVAGSSAQTGSADPSRWLMMAAALGLGVLLGAFLGWTQSTLLRHRVAFPLRWVGASVLAWAPAMAIIFLGATTPAASWSVIAVLGLAALTGILAGAVLGLVLGWSAPSLTGTGALGRILLAVLNSRRLRHLAPRGLIGLKVKGTRTGAWHALPVMAAWDGAALVVLPGRPDQKRWWRNLVRPSRIEILDGNGWQSAEAWVIRSKDLAYHEALSAYHRRFPRLKVPAGAPMVRIIATPGAATTAGPEEAAKPARPGPSGGQPR